MDYKDYRVEDFVQDESFVVWVNSPDPDSNAFWTNYVHEHPEQQSAIREARKLVLTMYFKETTLDDASIIRMKSQIDLAILEEDSQKVQAADQSLSVVPDRSWWKRMAAAVIVLAIAGGTLYFLRNRQTFDDYSEMAFSSEENQIYKTAKGKRSVVTLDDGTTVWLNADSRIAFGKHFGSGDRREVFLDGEAFFDVAEDKTKPFIVNTTALSVKVLGTAFNVRSFSNDATIEATLVRGKIALSTGTGQEDIELSPNQQAVYMKQSRQVILENEVEVQEFTSWKAGKLYFKDEPFAGITEDLERWYDVKFHVDNQRAMECRFSAKIDNKSLDEVLELFKATGPSFDYRIEGKDVFITGNFCDQ